MRIEEIKANVKFNIWEENKIEFEKYLQETKDIVVSDTDKGLFANEIISLLWNANKDIELIEYVLNKFKLVFNLNYDLLSFYRKYDIAKTEVRNKGEFLSFESILDVVICDAPFQLKYEWDNLFVNIVWNDRDKINKYQDTLNQVIAEMKRGMNCE